MDELTMVDINLKRVFLKTLFKKMFNSCQEIAQTFQ